MSGLRRIKLASRIFISWILIGAILSSIFFLGWVSRERVTDPNKAESQKNMISVIAAIRQYIATESKPHVSTISAKSAIFEGSAQRKEAQIFNLLPPAPIKFVNQLKYIDWERQNNFSVAGFFLLSILGIFTIFPSLEKIKNPIFIKQYINTYKTKKSEQLLSLALKAANVGVWQWFKTSEQLIWSDENYKLLGYSPKSFQPKYKDWLKAIHPEDRKWADNYMRKLLPNKENIHLEYRVLLPDGSVRWLEDIGQIIYDDVGNKIGMIGIKIDITKRKVSEEALQQLNQELETCVQQRTAELDQTQQRLEYLLSHNPAVIYSCQASGDYRATFVSANSSTLVGYEAEEFLNIPELWIDNIHPDDLQMVLTELSQLNEKDYVIYEYRFRHKNGSYRWMQDELKFIQNDRGNPRELIGYWIDITERKQAELEIISLNQELENRVKKRTKELEKSLEKLAKKTRQLESINQELDSFSYSVSHDLRAPLRHINGFVHGLKQELEKNNLLLNGKVIHYLQIIDESSQKMGRLIDGLLALSKVGRRELVLSPVALKPLVETAINLVTDSENTKNIKFKIGDLPTVEADATLLQQVFVNLIDNAVKFSQDRSPRIIEINCTSDRTIFVKDNGVGFSMKYADRLFGTFQRLHSQEKFKGHGIGLSIVQRIIHRHNGNIWAESEPERGATFFFKLN